MKSQISSCGKARNRRHQVMPEAQPNLFGSIPQGIQIRSTKIMPRGKRGQSGAVGHLAAKSEASGEAIR
jgi:hypothetical protein